MTAETSHFQGSRHKYLNAPKGLASTSRSQCEHQLTCILPRSTTCFIAAIVARAAEGAKAAAYCPFFYLEVPSRNLADNVSRKTIRASVIRKRQDSLRTTGCDSLQ